MAKPKVATCSRKCKGTGKRFRSCVSDCAKGDYRWRKSKRKSKGLGAATGRGKGRCTKWSKGHTRCMRRAH